MVRGQGDNVTVKIFLWFMFIVIGLFLAFWLYSMYNDYIKSGAIDEGSSGALNCGAYIYKIYDINYENGDLSFMLKNTMGDPLTIIEVKSETETRERDLGKLIIGREVQVTMPDFPIDNNFVVYPQECLRFNSKEFTRSDGEWQGIS